MVMKQRMSRGRFAAATAAAFASIAVVRAPARAAQFSFKYGTDQTISSPVTTRAKEMWTQVEKETGGRLHVDTFPDSTLGGDTQMISQVRSGALQFLTEPGSILGSVSAIAQLDSLAFAFKDTKTAFAACDGDFGDFIRKEIAKVGVYVLSHPWDNGFREITANKPIRTAADLEGLKMRVPASPISLDLFRSLGAAPVPMNVSELYTGLQTHIVEGQENALININQPKLYEVQKTLNFSNHSWDCWWWLVNQDAWNSLPKDIQDTVQRNVTKYAYLQRRDFAALTGALTDKLHRYGMQIVQCDTGTFKARLGDFYKKWHGTFGDTGWGLLEKYTGKLG
jgi:tripartite ATP-independent transporter DctP family solute receptor